MLINRDYYEEVNQNDKELQKLDAEYTIALCYAMICSQMGN